VRRSVTGKPGLASARAVAKTTDYSRIQVLLELATTRRVTSAEDLVQSIIRRSPPNFVFHRWDREKGEVVGHCSETSVRKTLELASDLGLVDGESGALTTDGIEASDPDRFSNVVRKRLQTYLSRLGCPLHTIVDTCVQMLKRKSVVLPTSDELYIEVCVPAGIDLDPSTFRTLLRLLAQCDGLRISRRHIFLPPI